MVIRRGRRKIHNEEEFMETVQKAGAEWCKHFLTESSTPVARGGEAAAANESCAVVAQKVYFGETHAHDSFLGLVERDIYSLQRLAVVIGLQGSGMVNGLYLSPVSSVLAVYLNDGWPISNGDPLALIGHRGPYIRHVNTNSSKILCSRHEDKVSKCDVCW